MVRYDSQRIRKATLPFQATQWSLSWARYRESPKWASRLQPSVPDDGSIYCLKDKANARQLPQILSSLCTGDQEFEKDSTVRRATCSYVSPISPPLKSPFLHANLQQTTPILTQRCQHVSAHQFATLPFSAEPAWVSPCYKKRRTIVL